MPLRFEVQSYDRLGSTNDEAGRLAREGAAAGTVVVAAEQTAGRGRLARHWASPRGNLHASVVLRSAVPQGRAGELAFVVALAVADAVDAFLPPERRARLKWPNDVLVEGAKISGVLIEQVEAAFVVGIGTNVRYRPADTPYPVTALSAAGANGATVEAVLDRLLVSLGTQLGTWEREGFAPIRAAWLARAHPVGTPLVVGIEDAAITGRFAGLAADGALLLETESGLRRIVAGDVRPASYSAASSR